MSAEQLLESFLTTTVESAEMNTEYLLCPELEDVAVTVIKAEPKAGTFIDKNSGEERMWAMLNLQYEVDSEEAREAVKRDKVTVYGKPIFLTIKDGGLDMDNNQQLARMLKMFDIDITGLSIGEIFNSFLGQYGIAKITHRALTQKDGSALLDDEGEQRYSAEVSAIGRA